MTVASTKHHPERDGHGWNHRHHDAAPTWRKAKQPPPHAAEWEDHQPGAQSSARRLGTRSTGRATAITGPAARARPGRSGARSLSDASDRSQLGWLATPARRSSLVCRAGPKLRADPG